MNLVRWQCFWCLLRLRVFEESTDDNTVASEVCVSRQEMRRGRLNKVGTCDARLASSPLLYPQVGIGVTVRARTGGRVSDDGMLTQECKLADNAGDDYAWRFVFPESQHRPAGLAH